jgi:photosystem II stability/assembly factor-like uncharacterized protein
MIATPFFRCRMAFALPGSTFVHPPGASLLLGVFLFLGAFLPGPAAPQGVDPELLGAMEARSIGPAGMGGRITAVEAVASNPEVVFAGSAMGGLWRSLNGGTTWEPVFHRQEAPGVGAVAVFQGDPRIVWVGTGEGSPGADGGPGAGVFKSTDGGRTWGPVGLEGSERISRIVLHPTDPKVAFVAAMGPAGSEGGERGVYRTTDEGATWQRVLFVDGRTGATDLVMDPNEPRRLLGAMWEHRRLPGFLQSGGPGSGLFLSEDGGDTWTRLTPAEGLPSGDLGRLGLGAARSAPGVFYALVEGGRSALLRSVDGGRSWSAVSHEAWLIPALPLPIRLMVDPRDPERLFHLHSSLLLSEDGGRSFRSPGSQARPGAHSLWIHPLDPGLLYLGSEGGVYLTRDGGLHWHLMDQLPVGHVYHVSLDMEVPFNVYGGMEGKGAWRGPSDVWAAGGIRNQDWRQVGAGDGFGALPDPRNPHLGYSVSEAGGLTRFDLVTGDRKDIRPWAPEGVELRFSRSAPLVPDPFTIGAIYFGSQFVHRSVDRGQRWQILSVDLTGGGLGGDGSPAGTLLSIAPSPVERDLIWVGSSDGRIHVTRSGGGEWEEVGSRIRGAPRGAPVTHIEASKHHASVAYVVFGDDAEGRRQPHIYRTEDYGRRWVSVASGVQLRGPVHILLEDPVTPNLLFAATDLGIYVSLDRGARWFTLRTGIPPVPVRSLAVHPRDHDLVVGTLGRSLYVLDDVRPLRAMARDPGIASSTVHLFDPPPAYLRSEGRANGPRDPGDAPFRGQAREPGAVLTFWVSPSMAGGAAVLRILDIDGGVLRTLEAPARAGLNRVTWDLLEDGDREAEAWGMAGDWPFRLEVLPGLYEVRVRVGSAESSRPLTVLEDPRTEIPMPERIHKRQALERGVELGRVLLSFQQKRVGLQQDLGRIRELLGSREDTQAQSLREGLEAIWEAMEGVSRGLWDVERYRPLVLKMTATRDAPTEAEQIALFRIEDALERVIDGYNGLFVERIVGYRGAVREAGLGDFLDMGLLPRVSGG